jgi:uncharacterized membrane protein (DUF485 family)
VRDRILPGIGAGLSTIPGGPERYGMATSWSYLQNGQAQGPVSEDQIKAMLATGALTMNDLVWREGLMEWVPIRQAPGLMPASAAIELDLPPVVIAPVQATPTWAPPSAGLDAAGSREISADVVELLRQTKPWTRFLAVLGFVGIGLMVLAAFAMLAVGSLGRGSAGFGVGMMLVYLIMAGLYVPPVLFLSRYASRIGDLVASRSTSDLEGALAAQKSFWRYVGILTLVMLCVYAVVIAVALVAGVAMRGLR